MDKQANPMIDVDVFHNGFTLWLFRMRLSFGASYYPTWKGKDRPFFNVRNNGGRESNECLDINGEVGLIGWSITLWQIGSLSWLIKKMLGEYKPRVIQMKLKR